MPVTLYRIDDRLIHGQVVVADPRRGIIVTPDIATMQRFISGVGSITDVNVGGIHHRAGRFQKMRYVFLSPEEESELRGLIKSGVRVTAQDVPTARAVPMNEVLGAEPGGSRAAG